MNNQKCQFSRTDPFIYYASGASQGFLQSEADIGFRTNYYTYLNGNLILHTNELGLATSNTWDTLNRLVGTSYPDGTTVSNWFNKLDIVGTKDRLNHWTYRGYNAIDQLVAVTNADGEITQYSYCQCGSPSQITRWNGLTSLVTTLSYDIQGMLINAVYPDGYQLNYTYDVENLRISKTDSGGNQWTYYYFNTGLQHLLRFLDLDTDGLVANTYDEYARLTSTEDRNNLTTTNGYDFLNRLVFVEHEDHSGTPNSSEGYAYSPVGLMDYTNQLGYVTAYARDPLGRILDTTNANNELVQYTYNPSSELLTLTDGKNQTTSWGYDQFGRVTNKVDAAGNTLLAYSYDSGNRLTNRWSNAKGNTAYGYDALGNLTTINYPLSPAINYSYDGLNRLTNMVDGVGTTAYNWTPGNQLASESGPWADDTVSYSYNNRIISSLSLLQPNASAWSQSYDYDALLRLTSVTSPAGTFTYDYNNPAASDVVQKILLPGAPNENTIDYSYDSMDRVTQAEIITQLGEAASHSYTYDAASERTQQTFVKNNYINYAYDNIGQLKTAQGHESGGTARLQEQFGYAYDAAWNLNYRTNNAMVQTFNVNNLNELTNVTRTGTLTVAGTATEFQSPYYPINSSGVVVSGTGLTTGSANLYADLSWAAPGATLADGTNTYTATVTDTMSRMALR